MRALYFVTIALSTLALVGGIVWIHKRTDRVTQHTHLRVVCTTGMIADALQAIGGDYIELTALMGPGVDPHLYRPRESDMHAIYQADVIVYNGLHLEGKMTDVFAALARSKPTIAVGDLVPAERLRIVDAEGMVYDPHIWFDVRLWADATYALAERLGDIDPTHRAYYMSRADAYRAQLYDLDAYVRESLARIPVQRRVLVTAHDAFGYFGDAYDVEVMGLQGVSTDSEIRIADVERLIDVIVTRRLPTIFVEASLPERALQAVQAGVERAGHSVSIGGSLYSDTLGEPGTSEESYAGTVLYNVHAITQGLA